MSVAKLILIFGCVAVIAGCGQKAKTNESMMKSEEFFKEIEAPVAMETNSQIPKPNAESTTIPVATTAQVTTPAATTVDQVAMATAPEKPTIQDIQLALKNADIYQGKVDGVMGPRTKKAIREFQEKNNLKADGKVGAKTWSQLKGFYNSGATSAAPEITTAQKPATDINTKQFGN